MAGVSRLVLPGYLPHGAQRGNRRQRVFCSAGDYAYHLGLLAQGG